jgi:hypothetical protein
LALYLNGIYPVRLTELERSLQARLLGDSNALMEIMIFDVDRYRQITLQDTEPACHLIDSEHAV